VPEKLYSANPLALGNVRVSGSGGGDLVEALTHERRGRIRPESGQQQMALQDVERAAGAQWKAEALVLLVVVAGVASHDHGID